MGHNDIRFAAYHVTGELREVDHPGSRAGELHTRILTVDPAKLPKRRDRGAGHGYLVCNRGFAEHGEDDVAPGALGTGP
ncbi:MAG TPA: hypothetical protein VGC68_01315 [Enterovirga sp.]